MTDEHDFSKARRAGARSASTRQSTEDVIGGLVVLGAALTVAFVMLAWPVGLVFLAVVAVWLVCRWIETVWTKAARDLLFPIMLGLGAFSFAQSICNILPHWISAARVWEAEHWAVESRAALHERMDWLDVPHTLIVLAVLLAATWFLPRLRLVTRFVRVVAVAAGILTTLTAATTFSLFSDEAVGRLAEDLHAGDVTRYQSAIRQEREAVGRYLASEAVNSASAGLDPIEAERLRFILERSIACHTTAAALVSCSEPVARRVAQAITEEALRAPEAAALLAEIAAAPAPAADRPAAADAPGGAAPVTRAGWQRQRRAVSEAEASAAELRAEALKAAASNAFSSVLTALAPQLEGMAGAYQDDVIGAVSDTLAELAAGLAERWQRSAAQVMTTVAAMLRGRVAAAKRLFVPASLSGKPQEPAITPDFVEATDARIKSAVNDFERQQEEIKKRGPRTADPGLDARARAEAEEKAKGPK
jgi:hypothetical protein